MPAMVIGSKGLAISSSLTQSILLLGRPLPRRGRRHAQDSAYPGAALVYNQADDGGTSRIATSIGRAGVSETRKRERWASFTYPRSMRFAPGLTDMARDDTHALPPPSSKIGRASRRGRR